MLPSWCVPFLTPPLLIALAGTTWHAVASGKFSAALLSWSLLVGLLFSTVGIGFLSLLEPRNTRATGALSSLSAYLVGFILVSSALLFLAFTSPGAIWLNLTIVSVVCAAALFSSSVRTGWKRLSFGKVEAFALLLILGAAGFWSQENLRSITVEGHVVVSHPWQDIPFHAMQVGLFAHSKGAGHLSNPLMSGEPVPLYHYGTYMAASLLCRLTGLDAYSLATGWYAPMAMVLTGLAAWSFGTSLLGPACGLAAVFGALLIPDPSYYWLGNRWTSYFFFQTVGIGGAYGVAILGMSWAFFFMWLRAGGKGLLLAALLFCALSLFFKALFVVYLAGLPIFAASVAPGIRKRTRAVLLGGVLVGVLIGVLGAREIPNAPTLAISSTGARVNLEFILNNFPSSSQAWLWGWLRSDTSYLGQLLFGIPLVLLTTYGLLLPACFLALLFSVQRRLPAAWTLFPLFILMNHLFVALCMDSNHGVSDTFEIIHKTFVFPYFAVAAWSGATLFSRFETPGSSRPIRTLIIVGAGVAALGCVYRAGRNVQSGMLWAQQATHLKVPRGLYDAAQFIRQHTDPDAVVQYSENDERAMLPALGERKAFVVRFVEPPFKVGAEEARRMQHVETLLSLDAADSLKGGAAALGIDWLLLGDKRQPPWAATLSPGFESQGFRLYHLSNLQPKSN